MEILPHKMFNIEAYTGNAFVLYKSKEKGWFYYVKIFSKSSRKICNINQYSLQGILGITSTKNASKFNKERLICEISIGKSRTKVLLLPMI